MLKYLHAIFLLFFISCSGSNSILLKSSKEFVTQDGGHIDQKYGSIEGFQKSFFKVIFLKDTIYATAIQSVNACGNAKASIQIEGDTIILSTKEIMKVNCNSKNWHKYKYWIANPKNKKYKIITR
jgi:hypothetical protein